MFKQGCIDMKSTILLTTALFLASAPSPDSKAVSEFSAGFLSPASDHGLMAAGPTQANQPFSGSLPKQLTANTTRQLKYQSIEPENTREDAVKYQ
jgi:hypothetical protein